MVTMIMKMSLIVFLYVALTAGLRLWVHTERSVLTFKKRILIGVIYGICAILSTHFGVVYDEMTINVRDAAPLAAGLFFDPVSGIIAGLVGGIERYIAGTYFGVGSYTRVACSISTCLAGFLAAAMNMRIFHGKKPSPFYAFFLGIVTEVFHMYAVLITHRSDMKMAFYVVDTCAKPMMVFTGLSLFFSAIVLYALSGKLKACIQKPKNEDIPISAKFQAWLFICIIFVLTVTFLFSYSVQTRTVLQNTQKTMTINTEDAKTSYKYLRDDYESLQALIKKQTLIMAHAVASAVDYFGGINNMPVEGLESMRDTYVFYEINLIDENGIIVASSNPLNNGFDMASSKQSSAFMGILSGEMAEYAQDFMPIGRDRNISLMYVGVKCSNGMVQVALDRAAMDEYGSEEEYSNLFGNRHIGENGVVYVADESDIIISGDMRGKVIDALGELPDIQKGDAIYFEGDILGAPSYCRFELAEDTGFKFLTVLPKEEVYISRDMAAYETGFADIQLFALVFILIYILVQKLVVNNLDRINHSLTKITKGNLNEVVNVRSTSEFASLSDDINLTVDALKGYIDQAEKRIEEELEFARQIQSAALPSVFELPRTEFGIFALMDPAKEVGGDFYDFFFVDKNKIALVIADVSGKGIPAALFMMRSKTAIKGLAEAGRSPAEIFAKANDTLCEGNDADMFVTAWIGIVDLETGVVKCANAGHEYPAVKRADGKWELYKDRHALALAAMEGMLYREYEIQLGEGDMLYVYTDGVPEAINADEEQFGTDRMLKWLNEDKTNNVRLLLPFIRRRIADFVGDADQFDDITMLGFKFKHKTEVK